MSESSNRRLAKNTILLYGRMIFLMIISFYTSRVILNTLGVVDYGINNVVSGVIALLGFLSNSLGVATSRFITFDLGKGDMKQMKRSFGNILTIHLLLALMILVLGETIGFWFMDTQLQIPEERKFAAIWVYQFSILTMMVSIISVPYNATIIAHERMSAFAYIGLIDAVLKLLICYILVIIPYDKLIIYAFLYFCIQALDRIIYGVYCSKNFEETHASLRIDKDRFAEIFSFIGWTLIGGLAAIGGSHGVNILLNIFFGPAVNAARGIAVQVQGVIQNFVTNFQMAINPQLTKSYAQDDMMHMHQLIILSSKFSFFLLLFIIVPVSIEAPTILSWWLGIVPDYTISFLRICLCTSMVSALANPINTSVHATGVIKKYQIIEGSVMLMIVPVSYIFLKFFIQSPIIAFAISLCIEIIAQGVRISIVLPMVNLQIHKYIIDVIIPIIKATIMAVLLPLLVSYFLSKGTLSFFVIVFISFIWVPISIYFLGCTTAERDYIHTKFKSFGKRKQALAN